MADDSLDDRLTEVFELLAREIAAVQQNQQDQGNNVSETALDKIDELQAAIVDGFEGLREQAIETATDADGDDAFDATDVVLVEPEPAKPLIMAGVDRRTGKWLQGWPHVVQSIEMIIKTRTLTRVIRREFGSEVPRLQDYPAQERFVLGLYVSVAVGIARWEPRFELERLQLVEVNSRGQVGLQLHGIWHELGHLGIRNDGTLIEPFTVGSI